MYTTDITPEKAPAGFGPGCARHVFGEFARSPVSNARPPSG